MERTTATGNDSGLYTEGNPSSGIPATQVSAKAMNDLQEEIVTLITGAGVTLNGAQQNQLYTAVVGLIASGGTQASQALNNGAPETDVTVLLFDKTETKSAEILFDIYRKTDSSSVKEMGKIYALYDTGADSWDLKYSSHFDDAGVDFTISATGQIKYATDTIAGTNYEGTIRITSITKIAI